MKPQIKSFVTEYLAELIEGNAAIFAGAGLSVPAGYVDWRALLRPPIAKTHASSLFLANPQTL
jgi:hypothetical protein